MINDRRTRARVSVNPLPDPWQLLTAQWPWVKVYVRVLSDRWAQTVWDGPAPRIELAHDLGRVQQRCSLAHELHHLAAGRPCVSLCEADERAVVEATARWLLPDLAALGVALRDLDMSAAAASFDVTRGVLNDRLLYLSEAEEAEIAAALRPGTASAGTAAVTAAHGRPRRSPSVAACRDDCARTGAEVVSA
jgi:hypothetical protein